MASPELEPEPEQKEKRLICKLCGATPPDEEYLESHYFTHARMISKEVFESLPASIHDKLSKIDEKKREIKHLQANKEFIEEQYKRETAFRKEQIQREATFKKELEEREYRNKRRLEELVCINTGISPSGEGLKRLLSEE